MKVNIQGKESNNNDLDWNNKQQRTAFPVNYEDKDFEAYRVKVKEYKIKQLILPYAIENCISNGDKLGLSEAEKNCIINRTFTFKTTVNNFVTNQQNNFDFGYKLI